MRKILSAFVLMILVWGCAKKIASTSTVSTTSNTQTLPAEPTTGRGAEVTTTTITPAVIAAPKTEDPGDAAIAAGQTIYNSKCGRCHGLKTISDFTAERWTGILASMAPKANLTDAEKENVYAYIKANAKK
jgi:mono/diheme cytochrome c family protein